MSQKIHRPKWMALTALASDALSQEGTERLLRHLAQCEVCEDALIEIEAYEQVAAEVRDLPAPEIDWSKMELSIEREASKAARSAKRREEGTSWPLIALAAAALLAVIFSLSPRAAEEEPVVASIPGAELAAPEHDLVGAVVAVAGEVVIDGSRIEIGGEVNGGQSIQTREGGVAHVRLADGTGFQVPGASEVQVHRLTEERVVLELRGGSVANKVRTGTRYRVDVGRYSVLVRGTLFRVDRQDDDVTVTLDEGRVEIRRDDQPITMLNAPARWSSADLIAEEVVARIAVETPRLSVDNPILEIPPMTDIVAWTVDGSRFPAGNIAMRLPVGVHEVRALTVGGEELIGSITMLPEGARISEDMIRGQSETPAARPRASVGQLSASEIRSVVSARNRFLQQCYQRVLSRSAPDLSGRLRMRVNVKRDGHVRRVELLDETHPALERCITREANGWVFPEPEGGPVTFVLPLNLRQR